MISISAGGHSILLNRIINYLGLMIDPKYNFNELLDYEMKTQYRLRR